MNLDLLLSKANYSQMVHMILEPQWPMVTESGAFVQTMFLRPCLALNLLTHERGVKTNIVLPIAINSELFDKSISKIF